MKYDDDHDHCDGVDAVIVDWQRRGPKTRVRHESLISAQVLLSGVVWKVQLPPHHSLEPAHIPRLVVLVKVSLESSCSSLKCVCIASQDFWFQFNSSVDHPPTRKTRAPDFVRVPHLITRVLGEDITPYYRQAFQVKSRVTIDGNLYLTSSVTVTSQQRSITLAVVHKEAQVAWKLFRIVQIETYMRQAAI